MHPLHCVSRGLLLCGVLSAAVFADPLLVSKDPAAPYHTIQSAIDASPDNGVVHITAGIYEENLKITRPIKLQGDGWDKTTLIAHGLTAKEARIIELEAELRVLKSKDANEENAARLAAAHSRLETMAAIQIDRAHGVEISGLKLSTSPASPENPRQLTAQALLSLSSAEVHIHDCALLGGIGNGVQIANASDAQIDHCLIAALWNTGIEIGSRGEPVSKVNIHDCDIRNCYYAGIGIGPGNDVSIERCRISGTAWHGVRYDDASPRIENNRIFGVARSGIYASGKTAATVKDNLFYRNEMCGISCWMHSADTIENNTFADNTRSGLEILGASSPTVQKNIFFHTGAGIAFNSIEDTRSATKDGFALAPGARISDNLFFQNTPDIQPPAKGWPAAFTAENTPTLATSGSVADPHLAKGDNYTLAADSPAREKQIGLAEPLPAASPWPIQKEELAIIPDGPTRDYSKWKFASAAP
jgi:parallel beta-helix repeat protein